MDTRGRPSRTLSRMMNRPLLVVGITLVVTAILAIPFLAMRPDTNASQEPGGPVFDARDAVEDRFVSAVFPIPVIVESTEGNILSRDALVALRDAERELRADPEIGPTLLEFYQPDTGTDVVGVQSIADLVDAVLPGGLDAATDAQVVATTNEIIDRLGATSDALALSVQTTFDASANRWIAPALMAQILADNEQLGFSTGGVTLGTDTAPEEYARKAVDLLNQTGGPIDAHGVAIDVNLTSEEQGQEAGPFIGFTILAVLLIVGLTFRSYWVLALTGGALGMLIVWLYGIANLIGLENDLILSLIVPIAMISFGVDFTFHALGRYREERALGYHPRRAFVVGMAAVIGALTLALASDAAAFVANASSGIESLIQFGIAASVALMSAYWLLGIVTPLALMVIESRVGAPPASRMRTLGRVAASVSAGMMAMASVLIMVFVVPIAGLLLLGGYIVAAIVVPVLFSARREPDTRPRPDHGVSRFARILGSTVAWFAARRRTVLPVAAAITIAAAFLAVRVPTEFDVKDFFSADTEFVVGLDLLDDHVGERGGEPAQVYIQADLTDPVILGRVAELEDDLRALDNPRLATNADGETRVEGSALEVVDDVWSSPASAEALFGATGVRLTDADGDAIPDTRAQLEAVFGYGREAGVALGDGRFLQTPNDVRQRIWLGDSTAATTLRLGLTDTRRQEAVNEARDAVAPLVDGLRSELIARDPGAIVELTGGPIVRQESLEAISRALQLSLPIAVVLCFLIAAGFMRSARLAAVSVVPILITVALLYGFMELAGYSLNIVTATIGAVSIGIGIDFAVHYTMRYREELAVTGTTDGAVRRAGAGTGVALLASAVSSAAGFLVLAFAPMPLFASYGLLTAVMILMAATSTLLVLPSLLVAITPSPEQAVATEELVSADARV